MAEQYFCNFSPINEEVRRETSFDRSTRSTPGLGWAIDQIRVPVLQLCVI